MHEAFEPFARAWAGEDEYLLRLAGRGQKIVGYFCTYTPVELAWSAGVLPVRLAGGGEAVYLADRLTPSFICPYLRQTLERGLSGGFDYLSGLIQGYTCDAACGVTNIWNDNLGGQISHLLPLPYNQGPAARRYFRAALQELAAKLEKLGGKITDEKLDASLDLFEKLRLKILDLFNLRYSGRLALTAAELWIVLRAGWTLTPRDFLNHLERLTGRGDLLLASPAGGVPVLVSGSVIDHPRILEVLEECGARVAADDFCSGYRPVAPVETNGVDPWDRLMDRYLKRFPCPARCRAEDRLPVLRDLLERSGAKGVVFLFQKFCTPHIADLPVLKDALDRDGLPCLVIELDETGFNEGQVRTRIESFLELAGDR